MNDNNELQEYIMRRMQEAGITDPSLEDIDKFVSEWTSIADNRPYTCFQEYSPIEMRPLTYNAFDEESPIQLTDFTDVDYTTIPILQQAKLLMQLLDQSKEIKLTPKGNLPLSAVKSIYAIGIPEYMIESGITKLTSEDHSIAVQIAKISLLQARLIKVRNKKLSLTKNGKAIIDNDKKLLIEILKVLLNQFNTAYFDGYDSENTGIIGLGFTLILLDKYGDTEQNSTFYAEKYFDAYQNLIYEFIDNHPADCYSLRTFDRLLLFLGLITIDESIIPGILNKKKVIRRTDLFKKLFKIAPPKSTPKPKITRGRLLN